MKYIKITYPKSKCNLNDMLILSDAGEILSHKEITTNGVKNGNFTKGVDLNYIVDYYDISDDCIFILTEEEYFIECL